jgi:hypothetical protein
MNHPQKISVGHLEAVSQLLDEVAPDLSLHIKALINQPRVQESSGRGHSAFVSYPFNLRANDANAILLALEDSRETHGPNQTFCGFSIPALIMIWQALLAKVYFPTK